MTYNIADKTIDIVSVYLENNKINPSEVADLIKSVHMALKAVNLDSQDTPPPTAPRAAMSDTVTPDHIISLEDGKAYKSLGRHLNSRGLTPDRYRAKWGLDPSYPMVAPNHAKRLTEVAKTNAANRQRNRASAASGTDHVQAVSNVRQLRSD